MKKKKSKIGFWVIQLRRPLCFLVVVALVLSYNFISNAEGTGTFRSRFSIPDSVTDFAYRSSNSVTYWTNDGNSSSVLYINGTNYPSDWGAFYYNYNQWYTYPGAGPYSNFMNFAESYTFPTQCTISNVTYDLTSCPIYCVSNQSGSINSIYFIVGSGKKAFVDTWLISDDSFIVILWTTNFPNDYSIISNVDIPADNGLYLHTPQVNNSQNFTFTDLPIYFRSSDGSSGYSTFSSSDIGDFDVNEIYSDNYYDFNYLRTGGSIISPDDPSIPVVSDVEANAYHNMAITMRTNYVGPYLNTSCECRFNYGWNEYILTYPNLFEQVSDYEARLVYVSASGVETEQTYHYSSRIPCQSILTNLNHMANDGSKYSEKLLFTNFIGWVDALGEHDLEEGLNAAQNAISGSGAGYGSWLNLFENVSNSVNSLVGIEPSYLWTPNNNRGIKEFTITGEHYIASVKDNVTLKSGVYKDKADFVQNDYFVMQNDIPVNYYPYEDTPPSNLPSGVIQNNSLYPNMNSYYPQASGSISNFFNSIEAKVEYLFNLDASDLNNIAGNSQNTIQYVINSVSDNSENGFWGVLEKGYSVIPDDIWNWIKVSVATLLGGAIIGWVYNGVRVKR